MSSLSTVVTYTISGLDNTKYYDFEFWGSTTRTYEDGGKTNWLIGSNNVSIEHYNYNGAPVYVTRQRK